MASTSTTETETETETVHTLLRHILRAFYTTRQIIAYDILLKHSTLRDIHLATLMNLTPKEVHKFLAPLILDSILQQHSKAEPKLAQDSSPDLRNRLLQPPQPQPQESSFSERKPRQRIYYYVDYRTAVDA